MKELLLLLVVVFASIATSSCQANPVAVFLADRYKTDISDVQADADFILAAAGRTLTPKELAEIADGLQKSVYFTQPNPSPLVREMSKKILAYRVNLYANRTPATDAEKLKIESQKQEIMDIGRDAFRTFKESEEALKQLRNTIDERINNPLAPEWKKPFSDEKFTDIKKEFQEVIDNRLTQAKTLSPPPSEMFIASSITADLTYCWGDDDHKAIQNLFTKEQWAQFYKEEEEKFEKWIKKWYEEGWARLNSDEGKIEPSERPDAN